MIPYRTLGSTSERVSGIGIGGYHLGASSLDDSESVGIVRRAIDEGVSFLDNSWDYCDGRSELRLGKALRDGIASGLFCRRIRFVSLVRPAPRLHRAAWAVRFDGRFIDATGHSGRVVGAGPGLSDSSLSPTADRDQIKAEHHSIGDFDGTGRPSAKRLNPEIGLLGGEGSSRSNRIRPNGHIRPYR